MLKIGNGFTQKIQKLWGIWASLTEGFSIFGYHIKMIQRAGSFVNYIILIFFGFVVRLHIFGKFIDKFRIRWIWYRCYIFNCSTQSSRHYLAYHSPLTHSVSSNYTIFNRSIWTRVINGPVGASANIGAKSRFLV
jgi:hypothetical protein